MQTEKHGQSLTSWSLEAVRRKQTVCKVIKSARTDWCKGRSKGDTGFTEKATFKQRSEKQRTIGTNGETHWAKKPSQEGAISKVNSVIFRQLIERQNRIVNQNSKNV